MEQTKDIVNWDRFIPILVKPFGPPRTSDRRSWDYLVIFRSLLLGILHSVSDSTLPYKLLDRTSFKRFVGLHSLDQIPEPKTLWTYHDVLAKAGCPDALGAVFKEQWKIYGYELTSGAIVDSSLIPSNRHRTTREKNTMIKEGTVPLDWEENPAKTRHKDVAAVKPIQTRGRLRPKQVIERAFVPFLIAPKHAQHGIEPSDRKGSKGNLALTQGLPTLGLVSDLGRDSLPA